MKRRIMGLENEYGLTCTLNGQRRLSPDNVARYLFEKVIPGARNAAQMRDNASASGLRLPEADVEKLRELWRTNFN